MPKRLVNQTIVVMRDGKKHIPAIDSVFEFTADEIKEINQINPAAFRMPVNELAPTVSQDELAEREAEREARAALEAKREADAKALREKEAAEAQAKLEADAAALKASAEAAKAEADAKAKADAEAAAKVKKTARSSAADL